MNLVSAQTVARPEITRTGFAGIDRCEDLLLHPKTPLEIAAAPTEAGQEVAHRGADGGVPFRRVPAGQAMDGGRNRYRDVSHGRNLTRFHGPDSRPRIGRPPRPDGVGRRRLQEAAPPMQ